MKSGLIHASWRRRSRRLSPADVQLSHSLSKISTFTFKDIQMMLAISYPISCSSTMHILHTRPALRLASITSRGYARQPPVPGATAPAAKSKSRSPTKRSKASGDVNGTGTGSSEYNLVDTDPTSTTSPYDHPRTSGTQLRYGGKENIQNSETARQDEPRDK